MRDPNRIDVILDELKTIWKEHPDLRLGQLLLNIASNSDDLYFMEDEQLIKEVKELYENLKNKNKQGNEY